LLAYSKIWLNNHLLASDVPEDPYLSSELERYFPAPVRERFPRAIARHRLRREIIATATTNSLVNRMGPTFVPRAQVVTGAEPARFDESRGRYAAAGLPPALAARVASLEALNPALDIVEIAAAHRVRVAETARVYFEVGTRIGFDWLRARIEKLTVEG